MTAAADAATDAMADAMADAVTDAHVHFWDPAELRYPWLDAVPALGRAFLPDAYGAATAHAPVARVVFVEANCRPDESGREVAFAERLAAADPRIAGVVAFADLTAPDAPAAIDALAGVPLVKGVRHNVQGEPPGFCLDPRFVAGVREVGRRGLAFDLCATHDQLGEVLELARRCPDTRLVLDHGGKPAIRDGATEPWAARVAALGALGHVCCKLSGLLTEAGARRRHDDLAPYAARVVDAFGTGRVLYGSDWPVLTLAGTYAEWYAFTRRLTAGWSAGERAAFYGGNAERVYRLETGDRGPGARTLTTAGSRVPGPGPDATST